MDFYSLIQTIDTFIWGPPLIILLVGTGIFLTCRLRLIQVFKLPLAMKLILTAKNKGSGDISSFKALCLAMSATIGTGNIVGVATAIAVGGPGAIFWMWVSAFFGMATKYAEGLLAIKFRSKDEIGQVAGGPVLCTTSNSVLVKNSVRLLFYLLFLLSSLPFSVLVHSLR